jgi:hypothetical protein
MSKGYDMDSAIEKPLTAEARVDFLFASCLRFFAT